LADKDVSEIYAIAGGQEGYAKMMDWAKVTLSAEERDAFDNLVDTGNKHAIAFAVRGLKAQYAAKFGTTPKIIKKGGGGKGTVAETKGFESLEEVQKAMADKRYGKDEAYTKKVDAQAAVSKVLGYQGS
jgi:hypothetical protein